MRRILWFVAALLEAGSALRGGRLRTPMTPTPRCCKLDACMLDAEVDPVAGDVVVVEHASFSGVGLVTAEMSCTAWVQPLLRRDRESDAARVPLVEDSTFEQPLMLQDGILAVLEGVVYHPAGATENDDDDALEHWCVDADALPDHGASIAAASPEP